MQGRNIGALIGAVFGLVFVVVNSDELGQPAATVLRLAGLAASVGVVVAVFRAPRVSVRPEQQFFGLRYWLLVAGEVVAIAAGLAVLNGPLDASYAGVAWVALVVGVHFLPMGRMFGVGLFRPLGLALAACGAVGLVLAASGAGEPAVAAVGGVLPGALLLGFSWWAAVRVAQPEPSATV